MNLVFFSIDIEHGRGHQGAREGTRAQRQQNSRRYRALALAIVALVLALTIAVGGLTLAGGDAANADLLSWIELEMLPSSTSGGGTGLRVDFASDPSGATLLIDGRQKGKTPLALTVSPGEHTLVLKHPDALDEEQRIHLADDQSVHVNLWRRRPEAVQLRPPYPGSKIKDAAVLTDGRLAVTVTRAVQTPGSETSAHNEPWIFEPATGNLAPIAIDTSNHRPGLLAVSPDGRLVAYLRRSRQLGGQRGTAAERADEVWVSTSDSTPPTRVFRLPANTADTQVASTALEELHDLVWTPDGQRLLVTAHLVASGGYAPAPRSRLLLVNASLGTEEDAAVELVVIPADIVRGTYIWAPDRRWVAFLTQARVAPGGPTYVALCALDTTAGGSVAGFRYVADLGRQADASNILPVAPAAWAPSDGRLVFTATTPKVAVSNLLGLPGASGGDAGLFMATPGGPALRPEEGRRLGPSTGLLAPGWSASDGPEGASLVALARSDRESKPLVVRAIDPTTGAARELGIELPATVGSSTAIAGRWGLGHGRLLVLARQRDSSLPAALDYWLVQLRGRA